MVLKNFIYLQLYYSMNLTFIIKKDQEKRLQMMKLVWKMSLLPKQKGLLNFLAFFITKAY